MLKVDEKNYKIKIMKNGPYIVSGGVPLYKMAIGTDDDGKTTWSVSGMTSDPGEGVYNWYKGKMSGWQIEGEYTMENEGEKTWTFAAGNADFIVSLMIFESKEGEVNVVENVQEK